MLLSHTVRALSLEWTGLEGSLERAGTVGPGTLLVEHPAVTFPGRSVTLVYDLTQNVEALSGNTDWVMRGLVVNRPLPITVAEAFPTAAAHGGLGGLADAPLFLGGLSGTTARTLSMLHKFPEIAGSVPIADTGLYAGGTAADGNKLIEQGKASPEDFKLFQGHEEWVVDMETHTMPGMHRYMFCTGSLTAQLSLLPAMYGVEIDGQNPLPEETEAGAGDGGEAEEEQYFHQRFFHQNVVWAEVMRVRVVCCVLCVVCVFCAGLRTWWLFT